jgi:hypothetical protein
MLGSILRRRGDERANEVSFITEWASGANLGFLVLVHGFFSPALYILSFLGPSAKHSMARFGLI